LIVMQPCDATNNIPLGLADLDASTGQQLWGVGIAAPKQGACPLGMPKIAIRQDGAVVIANPLQVTPALVVLDGETGSILSQPTIPPSTIGFSSNNCDCFTPMGQPIVDPD